MNWHDDITKEKNLFRVYLEARKVGSSGLNVIVALLVFFLVFLISVLDIFLCFEILTLVIILNSIGRVADIGFLLATAILGFLIAGFSIFASTTPRELFKILAQLRHKKTQFSKLKFIFFNFLLVFIHYLIFLGLCITIKLALPLVTKAISVFEISSGIRDSLIWWYFATFLHATVVAWLIYLIMLLKSFVWNIYQTVLVKFVGGELIEDAKQKRREVDSITESDNL